VLQRPARRRAVAAVVAYATCVDYLVYGLVLPLIPFSRVRFAADEQVVLLGATYGLGVLIAAVFLSRYGDRIGYRRTMIGAAIVLIAATMALAWAPSMAEMLAGRVAQGVAAAATFSAGFSLLAEHYRERRVAVMGFAFMGSTVGSVVGPIAGGLLYAAGGYQLPFLAVLGLIAVDLTLRVWLLPRDGAPVVHGVATLTLLRDPRIVAPLIAVALTAGAWGIHEPLVPSHLSSASGASAAQIGTLLAIASLAYGFASPLVARSVTLFGSRTTMLAGAWSMAVLFPVVAVMRGLIVSGVVLCLVNVAYALLLNPTSAQLAEGIDARGLRCYSVVYSISNLAYSFGLIAGTLSATALLATLPFLAVMLAVGAVLALSSTALIRLR
jgi:DHA1 family solute carrier family 18 vesicular amine transporter 1/2